MTACFDALFSTELPEKTAVAVTGVLILGMQENLSKRVQTEKQEWRLHQQRSSSVAERASLSVGLAGSMTVEPLVPYLGNALVRSGHVPCFSVAPYNQIFQTCIGWEQAFGVSEDPPSLSTICILWRIDDLMADELSAFVQGDGNALSNALQKLDDLEAAVRTLRSTFPGLVVISIPPFPQNTEVDIRSLTNPQGAGLFHRTILSAWIDKVASLERVSLLDLDALQRDFGLSACQDARKWSLYHQPYTEGFWLLIGSELDRILQALTTASKKCIVLDCDNTLWGGIIGEAGVEGIDLGNAFPGAAFQAFQKQVLLLKSQGVLVALASKNNEEDVWEVFKRHDGMVLNREHIAASKINWEPKPQNIQQIATELNIGLDSLVFVDDSDFEIEQMKAQCPEVVCLRVPDDPAHLPSLLKVNRHFDRMNVTSEDRNRTEMYKAAVVREQAANELMSETEFLASLALKATIALAETQHLVRITQLVNKTNQFNLTTVRRTEDEIAALMESDQFAVFFLKSADRFGDYGLVGVGIVEISGELAYLDTLLMSCRVLGRGLDTAFLSGIASSIGDRGVTHITGRFIRTLKNEPVAGFFESHGFKQEDDFWIASVAKLPKCPGHITTNSEQESS